MQNIFRASLFAFAVLSAVPAAGLPGAVPAAPAQDAATASSVVQPAMRQAPVAPVGAGWG